MQSIHKIFDSLEKIVRLFIALAMGIMVVVVAISVFKRYFFGTTYIWADELVTYSMVWATFLGVAVGFRHFDLVLLDLFVGLMPKKLNAICSILAHFISLAFIAYIIVTSFNFAFSPAIALKNSTGLGVSMLYPFISIPIGFGLMFLFGLEGIPKVLGKYSANPINRGDETCQQ